MLYWKLWYWNMLSSTQEYSNIFFRKHVFPMHYIKGVRIIFCHHLFLLLETKEERGNRTKLEMASISVFLWKTLHFNCEKVNTCFLSLHYKWPCQSNNWLPGCLSAGKPLWSCGDKSSIFRCLKYHIV